MLCELVHVFSNCKRDSGQRSISSTSPISFKQTKSTDFQTIVYSKNAALSCLMYLSISLTRCHSILTQIALPNKNEEWLARTDYFPKGR